MDATVSLGTAWIESFLFTCVGVGRETLDPLRQSFCDFLEAGRQAPFLPDHQSPHLQRQALEAMGASRLPSATSDELVSVILKRLLEARSDQEDELFTSDPLVDGNGRMSKNLIAVIKSRRYCFLYDETFFEDWRQKSGTVPETREALDADHFMILQVS